MPGIVLDYELSSSWSRRAGEVDLRVADEATLRYACFLGDVVFVVGEADFSARWGWVPALDFAVSLRRIVGLLGGEPRQSFEFTESDAEIVFTREGTMVRIDANYASATGEVAHVDFSVEAERFLARVVRDLQLAYPGLKDNAFVSAVERGLAISS